MFYAVKWGDINLIEVLKTPLRNDVTDFVRSAISGSSKAEIMEIQNNLINAYQQLDIPENTILSKDARNTILEMNETDRFAIKNELIYLVTRIPDPTNRIPYFLQEINAKIKTHIFF